MRKATDSEDLPDEDAEGPNVARRADQPLQEQLRRHASDQKRTYRLAISRDLRRLPVLCLCLVPRLSFLRVLSVLTANEVRSE